MPAPRKLLTTICIVASVLTLCRTDGASSPVSHDLFADDGAGLDDFATSAGPSMSGPTGMPLFTFGPSTGECGNPFVTAVNDDNAGLERTVPDDAGAANPVGLPALGSLAFTFPAAHHVGNGGRPVSVTQTVAGALGPDRSSPQPGRGTLTESQARLEPLFPDAGNPLGNPLLVFPDDPLGTGDIPGTGSGVPGGGSLLPGLDDIPLGPIGDIPPGLGGPAPSDSGTSASGGVVQADLPEPGPLALLGVGLAGFVLMFQRRRAFVPT